MPIPRSKPLPAVSPGETPYQAASTTSQAPVTPFKARVKAVNNGSYGISWFASTKTLLANDIAIGSAEAAFYVGDSPNAATVVRDDQPADLIWDGSGSNVNFIANHCAAPIPSGLCH